MARSPERIHRILKKLERLWLIYEDQRLGQLLNNYVFGSHNDFRFFYQEDEDTEKIIDRLLLETIE